MRGCCAARCEALGAVRVAGALAGDTTLRRILTWTGVENSRDPARAWRSEHAEASRARQDNYLMGGDGPSSAWIPVVLGDPVTSR